MAAMLKRISVSDLRVGMYLHELGGAWLDHPFWRSSFKIEDAPTLQKIRASGIHEAWIDTDKGLDLDGGMTQQESDAAVEQDLKSTATPPAVPLRITMEEELARAAGTCMRAGQEVAALFQEARMGKAIRAEAVLPVVDEITKSVDRNRGVLAALTRLRRRDTYTFLHSVSVCALMVSLGNQIGLQREQVRLAGLAGLLHDIGKVRISPELINKREKLTDEEFALLRNHSRLGHQLLSRSQDLDEVVLDVCLHHHERADGSGYPEELVSDAISVYAKMAAVCDVYDATTSNRPYKEAWQAAYALRKMTEWTGHFDTRIFHSFVRTVGIYPIGTLVRLRSGYLAVVVDQSEQSLLKPRVKVFYAINKGHRMPPRVVDLSESDDEILAHEDPDTWGVTDLQALWSGFERPLF